MKELNEELRDKQAKEHAEKHVLPPVALAASDHPEIALARTHFIDTLNAVANGYRAGWNARYAEERTTRRDEPTDCGHDFGGAK